jgi:L,D-peptidoglycan transpeptidase YkuD (ErfK/YbiS/YcfS/YnhG family)
VQTLRDEITDLKRRTLIADAREQMAIVQKRAQEATSALKLAFASLKTYNAEVATLIGHFSSGEQVLIYGVSNQPAIARWFQKAIGKAGIAANPDRGDGLTPTEIAGRLDAWLADR